MPKLMIFQILPETGGNGVLMEHAACHAMEDKSSEFVIVTTPGQKERVLTVMVMLKSLHPAILMPALKVQPLIFNYSQL